MLLPIAAPVNSIVVPLAPMEIIPYRIDAGGQPRYLLFKRSDLDVWQWIAGGGEDDEKPEQRAAAKPAKKLVFLKKLI